MEGAFEQLKLEHGSACTATVPSNDLPLHPRRRRRTRLRSFLPWPARTQLERAGHEFDNRISMQQEANDVASDLTQYLQWIKPALASSREPRTNVLICDFALQLLHALLQLL